MAYVEDYLLSLIYQLNVQKNETKRHIFLLICATDPTVLRENNEITNLMQKIEENEKSIIFRLVYNNVRGLFNEEVKYFKDIDRDDQYREYLTTKLYRPTPSALEYFIQIQTDINKNYSRIIELVHENNLFISQPNMS